MGRELTHSDIEMLLGVYALDATEADETELVTQHLATCARCRAEVADHREVAAALAHAGSDAPPALWDRISGELGEQDGAHVIPFNTAKRARRTATTGVGWRSFSAFAAAAAVLIAFLTFKVADDSHRVGQLARAVQTRSTTGAALAALADPSATRLSMKGAPGRSADVVVLPDGRGWLVARQMPKLDDAHTYQLWAMVGTQRISLAVLGSRVDVAPFHVAPNVRSFALTEETAGGVPQPEHAPVLLTA